MHQLRIAALSAVVLLAAAALTAVDAAAQYAANPVPPTSGAERLAAFEQHKALAAASLFKNVPSHNVGPTVMSGRVVDIDVSPSDPTHFYVAYASGGLWRTTNNGTSFEPIFDHEASMTIGDIAVDWSRDGHIWVGTGENNSSRSSYAGTGLYLTTDDGKTWQHKGLEDTHRTGRIILHPRDAGTLWVAALGSLYSPSDDRGIYKTTDGGATWTKTLYVDENTGAVDLALHPTNPDVLLAATWHRERRAWDFVESGEGSGVYRSQDGGSTWTLVSTEDSGLPTGAGVGRIGLAVYPDDPSIVYALVDNQYRRPSEQEDEEQGLTRDALRGMSSSAFLALPDSTIKGYLDDERFPDRYSVDVVRGMVRDGDIEPLALVEFVEDANQLLFDTPVIGAEVYRSDDGGATWSRTHEGYLDQVYNSYGYYFGEIRVSPFDADRIYVLGVPLIASSDGGETFESIGGASVHADHQAMWVSPFREGHLIDGNDGGLNLSYDDGATWSKLNSPAVGQFYAIQVDNARPYNVYGGLQDNGVWFGPSTYSASDRWHASGQYPYESIGGGDGMQVEVDTRDNETVYLGSQFGFYGRRNTRTGERASTRPRHELGERPLRFNWQTPIHLSRHNQDIFYIGANRLYRSLNRGEDLMAISDDLTKGGIQGDVPYGTLTSIDESPLRFGLLYVGSDDGYIHVSRDGGVSWTRISDDLPQDLWVSRVEASAHEEGRVYATLNGYRWDNFDPHVYVSEDYGSTWTPISGNLPAEAVNVVVEDPEVESLLYVGTDHGLYVSTDRGRSYQTLADELPAAAVHDLKIQEREGELVVGTHGRSIYRLSLAEVRKVVKDGLSDTPVVFATDKVTWTDRWGTRSAAWRDYAEPRSTIVFYAHEAGEATIEIEDREGRVMARRMVSADMGLNYFDYDLSVDVALLPTGRAARGFKAPEAADNGVTYLPEGEYTLTFSLGGAQSEAKLVLEAFRPSR